MPANNRAVIRYQDGTTSDVRLTAKATIAAERKWGTKGIEDHGAEASYYMAWFCLGMPGGDFDQWLDTVEAIEEPEDPSSAAPEPGSSPESPPSPSEQG